MTGGQIWAAILVRYGESGAVDCASRLGLLFGDVAACSGLSHQPVAIGHLVPPVVLPNAFMRCLCTRMLSGGLIITEGSIYSSIDMGENPMDMTHKFLHIEKSTAWIEGSD